MPFRVGIIGFAGRGGTYKTAIEACDGVLAAVCDSNREALTTAATELPSTVRRYTDYNTLLESGEIDAVIVATPQQYHVEHSIAALTRGVSVLSEVPAGIAIAECERLAREVHNAPSGTIYRIAENYIYWRQNRIVHELVRRGLFGQLYYGEGAYIHDVRYLLEKTPWRRKWQMGIDGNTYPTHSLGPLLQWLSPGERVVSVSCAGSGYHHQDKEGRDLHQDTSVMLCKTTSGALLTIRLDLVSDRPSSAHYRLQGTTGAYESADAAGEPDRLWLSEFGDKREWRDISSLSDNYLPNDLRTPPDAAKSAGHGGGDYYVVRDFIRALTAVRDGSSIPEDTITLGIHEALDMTLPGLVSQQSIAQNGAWLPVPDSRAWVNSGPDTAKLPQLEMLFPETAPVPAASTPPEGYRVRQYEDSDETGYRTLMNLAGFGIWDSARIRTVRCRLLPGGFFVVEHTSTGQIVASAQSTHAPTDRHPEGGEMGWVAAHPEHRGKGLGRIACTHATQRLRDAGYRHIYLSTDDFRIPAIAIYLALGYTPSLYTEGTTDRWERIRQEIR
jgi:predicted dehydrogenase/ribosomal protein S18 acetylase RimI-like enzyme